MTFVRQRGNVLRELKLNPYTYVEIDGKRWDPIGIVSDGYELKGQKVGEGRFLFHGEFDRLQKEGRLKVFDNLGLFTKRLNIAPSDRDAMFLRFFWVTAVDECIAEELIPENPTERHMAKVVEAKRAKVIKDFHAYREDPNYDHGAVKRKVHGGSVSPNRAREATDIDLETLVFCNRTLIDHFRKWQKKHDLWELCSASRSHNRGGPKVDPRTIEYVNIHIKDYAGEILNNPTGLRDYINAHIENDNLSRGDDAQVPLVAKHTVQQAINDLPADRVLGGRKGVASAAQALRHISEGPQYKRLGEMVIFDCWNTHAFAILSKEVLEELQKQFPLANLKRRIVISAAVDAASGCFLAFDGGFSESAALTHRTLRMVMSDKSAIAAAAGCTTSWHMRLAPEGGISDWGPGYKSQLFLTAAMSIFDRFTYAAAGRPHLRGLVERTLRSMDVGFVRKFLTGGTRSGVHEKGDYAAEERAQAFFHELLKMITKYIVDVYHHKAPSRGGLSPRRKYDALYDRHQSKQLPNRDEVRLAFGISYRVQLNRAGLRFQDILYWNSWLEPVLHKGGVRDYWIKIDPEDLGAISVLLGNDWTTIEGPTEFNGVRLDDWLLQKAKLRGNYAEQDRIDFKEIVAPAIVELAQQAQALRAFHNIFDVEWTESKLRDLERNLRTFILYDRDAEGPEEALMGNSRMLGTIHTRNPGSLPAPPSSAPSMPSAEPDEIASPATLATDIAQSPADRPERIEPPSESPESAPASTRRTRKHLPKSNPEN